MRPAAVRASLRNQRLAVRAEPPVPGPDRGISGVKADFFTGRFFRFYSGRFAYAAAFFLAELKSGWMALRHISRSA